MNYKIRRILSLIVVIFCIISAYILEGRDFSLLVLIYCLFSLGAIWRIQELKSLLGWIPLSNPIKVVKLPNWFTEIFGWALILFTMILIFS
jgi:hypothetical protein